MAKTIRELVLEYFKNHPNEDLPHGPVVDWVTAEYEKEHGNISTEKGRAIVEIDLDGTYVLTEADLEESDKVKLFEHFIEDFKRLIKEN